MTAPRCHRCVTWIHRHLGRRGAALLFFAFLDGAVAWSLVQPETAAAAHALPSYEVLVRVPFTVWAAVWSLVALFCFVQAWLQRDQVAFGLVIALKLVWGSGLLAGVILAGMIRGIISAAIYLSLAAFVGVIAGWDEPMEKPPTVDSPPKVM